MISTHPIKRIEVRDDLAEDRWPATIPAVAQLMREGMDLPPGVTFIVGENGSGKSTLIEGIADAVGLPLEGGDRQSDIRTIEESSALGPHLVVHRGSHASQGFFLRAESMQGWITKMAELGSTRAWLHNVSHGESYLAMALQFMRKPGIYLLDEPESALSFASVLALMGHFDEVTRETGAQVVCATHSPVLCALPGATILELSDRGVAETDWADLDLVRAHRLFFDDPMRQLRHVVRSGHPSDAHPSEMD